MILTEQAENPAILSNVTSTNSFSIKTSAHAFKILSSSLYANKIRAIIRELSTNAYDSQVAAGRADLPFDVHLPSTLEPHFAIRDYGVGLDRDEVEHIYTTYFSSTKSDSNDYVGALGLGSKSPFSYTENFSVTAIKNGKKLNYSAYVNEVGFPSIALMGESDTDEPSGVEIRFGVQAADYYKFLDEAVYVYRWFKVHPLISTNVNYVRKEIEYQTKDIIPGIHQAKIDYRNNSYAVMGNIAYPIQVPNSAEVLGELAYMLDCGLVIEFEIGDLDFQASREGLSYIPSTIEAIRLRLSSLNDQLFQVFFDEAEKFENLWERAAFIASKSQQKLWVAACNRYVRETKFSLVEPGYNKTFCVASIHVSTKSISDKFNIRLRSFNFSSGRLRESNSYQKINPANNLSVEVFALSVNKSTLFIKRDIKQAAKEQIRYNCTNKFIKDFNYFWSVEAVDKTKEVKFDEFFEYIHNPRNIVFASELATKPTAERASKEVQKGVTVLSLEADSSIGSCSWVQEGTVAEINDESDQVRYYINISGHSLVSTYPENKISAKELFVLLRQCGISSLANTKIYGVRRADAAVVESLENWVNLEDHIKETLTNIDDNDIMLLARDTVSRPRWVTNTLLPIGRFFNSKKNTELVKAFEFYNTNRINKKSFSTHALNTLSRIYANKTFDFDDAQAKITNMLDAVVEKYPLLPMLRLEPGDETKHVVDYINLIDNKEK